MNLPLPLEQSEAPSVRHYTWSRRGLAEGEADHHLRFIVTSHRRTYIVMSTYYYLWDAVKRKREKWRDRGGALTLARICIGMLSLFFSDPPFWYSTSHAMGQSCTYTSVLVYVRGSKGCCKESEGCSTHPLHYHHVPCLLTYLIFWRDCKKRQYLFDRKESHLTVARSTHHRTPNIVSSGTCCSRCGSAEEADMLAVCKILLEHCNTQYHAVVYWEIGFKGGGKDGMPTATTDSVSDCTALTPYQVCCVFLDSCERYLCLTNNRIGS